jgi:hypothetical protein
VKLGDIVKLHQNQYSEGYDNPTTEFGVIVATINESTDFEAEDIDGGLVYFELYDSWPYIVKWDNGYYNIYKVGQLYLAAQFQTKLGELW